MTRHVFPGWYVVAAVFVQLMTSSGLAFYGLAIYLDALTDEQSFSTTSVSLATSVFFIVSGVFGQLVARLIERYDLRIIVGVGGIVCATSLFLLGSVTTVAQLYGVYILFAVGFALTGLIPSTTLVTRWFQVRRATALSIASTGLSVGAFTLSAPASALIDERGLAEAAPLLGLVFLVLNLAVLPWLWPTTRAETSSSIVSSARSCTRSRREPTRLTPSSDEPTNSGRQVDVRM